MFWSCVHVNMCTLLHKYVCTSVCMCVGDPIRLGLSFVLEVPVNIRVPFIVGT